MFCILLALQHLEGGSAPIGFPTRVIVQEGALALSPKLRVEVSRVAAGFWGAARATLVSSDQSIWQGPYGSVALGGGDTEYKLLRIDVDGNSQSDWVMLYFPRRFGAEAVSPDFVQRPINRSWGEAENLTSFSTPWSQVLCVSLGGLIVLDDEKTVYEFVYDRGRSPLRPSNPYVQGPELSRMVVTGKAGRSSFLRVSQPLPAQVWRNIKRVIEQRACDTDELFVGRLPNAQRIQGEMPSTSFEIDWRTSFEEGLAMYRRALRRHAEVRAGVPAEVRGTQMELALFNFESFFRSFPFDEIDPENRSAEYTAMVNDFAYYQMAPTDADDAINFEKRRVRVDYGVVAMLAHVIRRDPTRMVAYLNLADALWRNGKDDQAAEYYQQYLQKMKAAGKHRAVPARVIERSRTTAASSSTLQR